MTTPLARNEDAYDRLKVLYGISKLLASFEKIETIFPEILDLCQNAFPMVTAVLIDKRGTDISTVLWHDKSATQSQVNHAVTNGKRAFSYLTGFGGGKVEGISTTEALPATAEVSITKNYIVLPLVVNSLPAFGIIQLEGFFLLNEKDLEFVDSLARLIAVAVDLHHKRCAERDNLDRIKAHVFELENERALRESFVSLLTHDLRTPLSAARIGAQLIQRQADDPVQVQSMVARILCSVNRADQMIENLLDANRLRSGESLPLQLETCNISELTERTLEELSAIHGDRFKLKSPGAIEGCWDPKGLRRIIENLCNNAVKYGSANDPIHVSLIPTPGHVLLEVQNLGPAIPVEDQKSVFQQFHRTQTAQGSHRKGWGIGLTLVRGVAEAHGGTATVTSNEEFGTIFTVTLPIEAALFGQRKIHEKNNTLDR